MKNKKISLSEIFNFKNGKIRNKKEGDYNTFGSGGIIGTSNVYNAGENASIIARVGSYCGSTYFSKYRCYVTDNAIIAETKKNFDPLYAHYLLKGLNLEFYRHGSGQPLINQEILNSISVTIISSKDQKLVSNLFRTINEKIELNLKMNKSFEEIFIAIFKSWFVVFDLVKAKEEKKNLSSSKKIDDLFPDVFEKTNFGKIPKNWKISKFGDLVKPKRGKIITKSNIEPGNIPVVAGGINPAYFHSVSNVKSPVVTISASGNAGFVNLYYQDIWASDCSYINRDVTDFIYFSHSFLKINQDKIYHLRHGAVQQHINPKDLMRLEIITPPESLIDEYEKIVTPMHKKISNNLNEINILSSLRDLLLPKLISGRLRISDAEKLIDEVSA